MAWIESHQSLARHPKPLRLAARVHTRAPQVIGHLHFLWWWALDYASDGDLSQFAAQEIAAACEWKGDPDLWLAALHETRWIDPDGHLHKLSDYGGKLCRKGELDRQRQEKWRRRERKPVVPDTVNRDIAPEARLMSRMTTGATEHNTTEENSHAL